MASPSPPQFTRPHTFVTPDGNTILILMADMQRGSYPYDAWPVEKQNQYINLLQGHLDDLHADGSFAHIVAVTGVPMGNLDDSSRDGLIDDTSWKLTLALRHSTPTRIAETVDLLDFILKRQKRINNGRFTEALPLFYLGVAYSNIPGKEDEAIEAFTEGFKVFDRTAHADIILNELWARSRFARVLRQKGRIEDAMLHEMRTRQWIIGHLSYCAPSIFRKYIDGPFGTGEHITDHGEILEQFSQIVEQGPKRAIWYHGRHIKHVVYGCFN